MSEVDQLWHQVLAIYSTTGDPEQVASFIDTHTEMGDGNFLILWHRFGRVLLNKDQEN